MTIRIRKPLLILALSSVLIAAFAPACLAAGADPFTVPNALATQGVFSCTDLSMSGNALIDSAGVANSGPLNKGNVRVNGNITMTGNSLIDGDAIVGPGKKITTSGPARV